MSYEADLITYLLADASLTAIVSNRVYPQSVPQGAAMPAITVNTISGAPLYADEGEVGLDQNRVQISCYGDTYAVAKSVADAVRSRLSAKQDVTAGSTTFIFIMQDNEHDLRETGANAAEYRFFTVLDFIIWR
jgi:hypothetical protein